MGVSDETAVGILFGSRLAWGLGAVSLGSFGMYVISQPVSAPADTAFGAASEIEAYPQTFPSVTSVEFLSDQRVGVGTRYMEARLGCGLDGTAEVEVSGFVAGERVRGRVANQQSGQPLVSLE